LPPSNYTEILMNTAKLQQQVARKVNIFKPDISSLRTDVAALSAKNRLYRAHNNCGVVE